MDNLKDFFLDFRDDTLDFIDDHRKALIIASFIMIFLLIMLMIVFIMFAPVKITISNSDEELGNVVATKARVMEYQAVAKKFNDVVNTSFKWEVSAGMLDINEDGTVTSREPGVIDIYLFMYQNDFEDALKDYYELTGYPALVPRYALGNWWSRNNNYDDLELKELVDTFEKKQIPVSIMLLDKDWHKRGFKGKYHLKSGFTFDGEKFKNPAAMISYLHSKSIRLGLNINPTEGIYNYDKFYEEALKYLQADKEGKIPYNVFDPKFVDVYLKLFIHPLDTMGIDFFWIDNESTDDLSTNALLKHYQFYDMQRDYKRRPMVLAPDARLAPHRYPVLYSGKTVVSWGTLKKIPFYNASAFNNGVSFWSHDIGGYFKGVEDEEVYIEFGTNISPCIISPVESDEYKYMILPIRMKD